MQCRTHICLGCMHAGGHLGTDPYGLHRFIEISLSFHNKYISLLTVTCNFPDEILKMVWTFSANSQGFIRGE